MHSNQRGRNHDSWQDDVKDYTESRRQMPPQAPPVQRITRQKGIRMKRVRNPVTHTFYDKKQESDYYQKQSDYRKRHQDLSKKRSQMAESQYNIITNIHKHDSNMDNIAPVRPRCKRRHFSTRCQTDFDSLFVGGNRSKHRKEREFDIISNNYKKDHLVRKAHENRKFEANVMQKFGDWKKKHPNPIVGKSVQMKITSTKKRTIKNPHEAINPVTGEILNNELIARDMREDRKKINRCGKMLKRENMLVKKRVEKYNRQKRMTKDRINRITYLSDSKNLVNDRGYDIVSGSDYNHWDRPKWVGDHKKKPTPWESIVAMEEH